jgi:hypothetical protein
LLNMGSVLWDIVVVRSIAPVIVHGVRVVLEGFLERFLV